MRLAPHAADIVPHFLGNTLSMAYRHPDGNLRPVRDLRGDALRQTVTGQQSFEDGRRLTFRDATAQRELCYFERYELGSGGRRRQMGMRFIGGFCDPKHRYIVKEFWQGPAGRERWLDAEWTVMRPRPVFDDIVHELMRYYAEGIADPEVVSIRGALRALSGGVTTACDVLRTLPHFSVVFPLHGMRHMRCTLAANPQTASASIQLTPGCLLLQSAAVSLPCYVARLLEGFFDPNH